MGAPLKAWLLASAGLGFLIHGANAESLFHLKSSVWGCFDPNVTPTINDTTNPQHENSEWIAQTGAAGNCVLITPGSLWKLASADFNGITYVTHRGATGVSGSFWVPTADIDFSSPIQSVAALVKPAPRPIPPPVQGIPPPKIPLASLNSDTPSEGGGGGGAASDAGSANIATTNSSSLPSGGSDSDVGILIVLVLLVVTWLARRPKRRKIQNTEEAKHVRRSTRSSPKTSSSAAQSKVRAPSPTPVAPPEQGSIRVHPSSLTQIPRSAVRSINAPASVTVPNVGTPIGTQPSQPIQPPRSSVAAENPAKSLTPPLGPSVSEIQPPILTEPRGLSRVTANPASSLDVTEKFSVDVTPAVSEPTFSSPSLPPTPSTLKVFNYDNRAPSLHMNIAWKAAMFVALIEGAFDGGPEKIAETWLAAMPSRLTLTNDEIIRLRARLAWLETRTMTPARARQSLGEATQEALGARLATRTMTLAKARRWLDEATQEERAFYVWSATTAASAVVVATKSQVVVLEAIFDALTIQRNELFVGLNAGILAVKSTTDGPVLASEKDQKTLPPAPSILAGSSGLLRVSANSANSLDETNKFLVSVTPLVSKPTFASSDSSPTPPSLMRNTSGTWHPYGEIVVVDGISIADGMVYLGKAGPYWGSHHSSLIDPSLKVAPTSAGADAVTYWQDYRAFSPACRRRFLEWLASGRQNPGEDIGYVFLFFRGLERRLLADEPSPEEIETLVSEVGRLKAIYKEDHSFSSYSRRLLEAVAFLNDDSVVRQSAFCPDLSVLTGEMPSALRVAIAREVVAGRPLGFDLAAAALLGLGEFCAINRAVLDKARPEFLRMLRPRFEAKFRAGFLLRNRKDSHLRLIYQGASSGFSVDLVARAKLEHLPDPSSLTWTKLIDLAGAVAEELAPYTKTLSYYPARANSLYGLISCPPELHNTIATEARAWLLDLPSPAAVPFGELARHAIGASTAKWNIRHRRLVSEALAVMGYATEPDPDDGTESLEDDTRVQVFRCANRIRSQHMSIAWKAAMFVVMLDRTFDGGSEKIAETWLAAMPSRLSLTNDEATRLRARLAWLATRTMTLAKAKRSLGEATQEEREFCAWSATTAAGAVGIVTKSQVAVLEATYDALTVPRNALYAGLHAGIGAATAAADEPVLASEEVQETLYPIPPAPKPRQVSEDLDRLSRIRAETERVAAMLKDVFAEEEPATEGPTAAPDAPFAGLDSEHLAFLMKLLTHSEWTKVAFENAASAAGLMVGGAMETINEWAFDNFGDAVLEDGDPIVVHRTLLQVASGPVPAE